VSAVITTPAAKDSETTTRRRKGMETNIRDEGLNTEPATSSMSADSHLSTSDWAQLPRVRELLDKLLAALIADPAVPASAIVPLLQELMALGLRERLMVWFAERKSTEGMN
jgi:hypothetical protein